VAGACWPTEPWVYVTTSAALPIVGLGPSHRLRAPIVTPSIALSTYGSSYTLARQLASTTRPSAERAPFQTRSGTPRKKPCVTAARLAGPASVSADLAQGVALNAGWFYEKVLLQCGTVSSAQVMYLRDRGSCSVQNNFRRPHRLVIPANIAAMVI
jgi:hypothetical protein